MHVMFRKTLAHPPPRGSKCQIWPKNGAWTLGFSRKRVLWIWFRPCVRASVRNAFSQWTVWYFAYISISAQRFFSGTAHYFFLIFCMKLGINKGSKLTFCFFSEKLLFPWKPGQKVKFGPKIGFFENFSRTLH